MFVDSAPATFWLRRNNKSSANPSLKQRKQGWWMKIYILSSFHPLTWAVVGVCTTIILISKKILHKLGKVTFFKIGINTLDAFSDVEGDSAMVSHVLLILHFNFLHLSISSWS
ncbi:unnamed protein product [Lactuca virosa]|uniref:Uncharacterized protein n=1 Tax=Lactuca virosa TaxID=75947 RepID=A0AAU9NXF8_9ASTR|nr:unnamed protein product [Lactuca virosa]